MDTMDETTKKLILETATLARIEGLEYTNKLLSTGDEKYAFLMHDHPHNKYYNSLLNDENWNTRNMEDNQLRDPSPYIYITYDPTGVIPSEDLNIIKKTAEYFVISNTDKTEEDSEDFLSKMKKELAQDLQFEFLKDDHSLNLVFRDFISQYKNVLSNNKPFKDQDEYLRQCFEKATYNEYKKQFQKENKEIQDLYKIRFAAINWLKFQTLPKIENLFKSQNSSEDKTKIKITYKEPLDFSKLTKKQISNTELTDYINEYFEGKKSTTTENSKENTPTSQAPNKTKKRKGKILIKGKGETRINKKRK